MTWYDVLPADRRAAIEARFLLRQYRRGDVIAEQGDPSTNVYLLDDGHVAVRVANGHGDSMITTVQGPHTSFGEIAYFLENNMRSASIVALDAVRVRLLPGRVFSELRTQVPAVDGAVAESLAVRLKDLSDRFTEIAFESVQRRCGRRLVELGELFASPGSNSATIPLTQDDLAGLVGATRPTVNQAIGQLAQERLLLLHRGLVEIPDRAALRRFLR